MTARKSRILPWRRIFVGLAGFALGLIFLSLAGANADLAQAAKIFRSADMTWIFTGIGVFGVDFLLRIVRWRGIVAHRSAVKWSLVARALFVGYAMNSLLPARLGELFRADYLAYLSRLPRSGILAAIFVERLLDLLAVLLLLVMGLLLAGVQNPTMDQAALAGLLVSGLSAAVVAMAVFGPLRRKARDLLLRVTGRMKSAAWAQRVVGAIRNFVDLLQIVGTWRFACSVAWTVLIWAAEALAIYSICRAVDVTLTPLALITLIGGASLSTLIPTGPGYVGSYQLAYVIVLQQFHISETAALVAATAVQIYLIGVYTALGLLMWITAILCIARRPASIANEESGF